jgi:hypothetical protein
LLAIISASPAKIILTNNEETARRLVDQGALLFSEVFGGGFDNSPTQVRAMDLSGKIIVHKSTNLTNAIFNHAGAAADGRAADEHRERVVEAAMRAANAPQPANSHDIGLKVGDDVAHPAFGEGVIIDISGVGEKAEAVINFAGVGTKHLALAWAPLKKLGA